MSHDGLLAEFPILTLDGRRPLVSNRSLERTFRVHEVPIDKFIFAERRSTQSR